MATDTKNQNQLNFEEYQNFSLKKQIWGGLFFLGIILGFFGYINFGEWAESKLSVALSSIPGCQLSYQEFDFSYFPLPTINLQAPSLSGKCTPKPNTPLTFKSLDLQFRGPGLFPFGLKFKGTIELERSKVDLHATLGLKSQVLAIKDGTINLSEASQLFDLPLELKGAALVNVVATIENQKVSKADYRLDLRSLLIPAQTINNLALIDLPLEKGQLLLSQTQKELTVQSMDLGGPNAPLRAEFKGKINLNPSMPQLSTLDLTGKVFFSPQLLEEFSIINLFTSGLKQDNGFYSLKIEGTLGAPRPKGL